MSAAWVPIEPVEPSRTMSRTGPPCPGCAVSMAPIVRHPRLAGPRTHLAEPLRRLARRRHLGLRLPVGPQRHARLAFAAQPDAEDLVQLDDVALEPEPRAGHV